MERKKKKETAVVFDEPLKTIREKEQRLVARVKELEVKLCQAVDDKQALEKDKETLLETNLSLKNSVSSYKGANSKLRKEIERLNRLVNEGDEMYEKKLSEAESLRIAICGKDKKIADQSKTIDGLYSQISSLKDTIASHAAEIKDLKGDAKATEANIEWFNSLPWWKKMFFKM